MYRSRILLKPAIVAFLVVAAASVACAGSSYSISVGGPVGGYYGPAPCYGGGYYGAPCYSGYYRTSYPAPYYYDYAPAYGPYYGGYGGGYPWFGGLSFGYSNWS